MKILVELSVDGDIIECPDKIIVDLKDYQGQFYDWLFDEQNDHEYWMCTNGKKDGCCYRSEAFVKWLNKFILNESDKKAKVVETYIDYDAYKHLSTLYF